MIVGTGLAGLKKNFEAACFCSVFDCVLHQSLADAGTACIGIANDVFYDGERLTSTVSSNSLLVGDCDTATQTSDVRCSVQINRRRRQAGFENCASQLALISSVKTSSSSASRIAASSLTKSSDKLSFSLRTSIARQLSLFDATAPSIEAYGTMHPSSTLSSETRRLLR